MSLTTQLSARVKTVESCSACWQHPWFFIGWQYECSVKNYFSCYRSVQNQHYQPEWRLWSPAALASSILNFFIVWQLCQCESSVQKNFLCNRSVQDQHYQKEWRLWSLAALASSILDLFRIWQYENSAKNICRATDLCRMRRLFQGRKDIPKQPLLAGSRIAAQNWKNYSSFFVVWKTILKLCSQLQMDDAKPPVLRHDQHCCMPSGHQGVPEP